VVGTVPVKPKIQPKEKSVVAGIVLGSKSPKNDVSDTLEEQQHLEEAGGGGSEEIVEAGSSKPTKEEEEES